MLWELEVPLCCSKAFVLPKYLLHRVQCCDIRSTKHCGEKQIKMVLGMVRRHLVCTAQRKDSEMNASLGNLDFHEGGVRWFEGKTAWDRRACQQSVGRLIYALPEKSDGVRGFPLLAPTIAILHFQIRETQVKSTINKPGLRR